MTKEENKKSLRLLNILYEYGDKSSIHGFVYIFTRKGSVFDCLFWVSIFLISGYFATQLTMDSFNYWQSHQVITALKNVDKQVVGMDFPAVTVCGNGIHKGLVERALESNYIKWVENKQGNEDDLVERYMQETFQIQDNSINILDLIDTMVAPSDEATEANFVRQNQEACNHLKEKKRRKRATGMLCSYPNVFFN